MLGVGYEGEGTNTIPRDDVAETMVQALRHEAFRNRSFDLRSKLEGDGDPTSDFARLLAPLGGRCEPRRNSVGPFAAVSGCSAKSFSKASCRRTQASEALRR